MNDDNDDNDDNDVKLKTTCNIGRDYISNWILNNTYLGQSVFTNYESEETISATSASLASSAAASSTTAAATATAAAIAIFFKFFTFLKVGHSRTFLC